MQITEQILKIKSTLPAHVKLVAVSKTKPVNLIQEAYNGGQRIFGENKVQELVSKYETLPKDIEWHMIGHLQSNKVKYIASFVHLIHGVDSFSLMKEINKQAQKNNRIQKILLQFHIALEETKFGFDLKEATEILESENFKFLENIEVCGVMGMATFTDNQSQIKSEFLKLKQIFESLKSTYFTHSKTFTEISMGMSGDYLLAVECGSTMVRIGSTIFGGR